MSQDEVLKIVGGIVVVVVIIGLVIFIIGNTSDQAAQLTNDNAGAAADTAKNAFNNLAGAQDANSVDRGSWTAS